MRGRSRHLSRRGLLQASLAYFSGYCAIPALSLIASTKSAKTDLATVSVAMNILGALNGLLNEAGGIGDQFGALNLKLDQILQNQIYALMAIAELQKSIIELEGSIGALLTKERYKDLTIEIYNLHDDTNRFIEGLQADKRASTNRTQSHEYNQLLSRLGSTISNVKNTFAVGRLDDGGAKAIHSLLVVAPALPVIVRLLDTFRSLERTFKSQGWKRGDYLYTSNSLKFALKMLIDKRIPEAVKPIVEEAKRQDDTLSKYAFWRSMRSNERQAEQGKETAVCFKSHILNASTEYVSADYMISQEIMMTYRSQLLGKASPTGHVFEISSVQHKDEWPAQRHFISRIRSGTRIPWPPISDAGECIDGLPVKLQSGDGDWYDADKDALQKLLPSFASDDISAFNGSVISQVQLQKIGELAAALTRALSSFDTSVGKLFPLARLPSGK